MLFTKREKICINFSEHNQKPLLKRSKAQSKLLELFPFLRIKFGYLQMIIPKMDITMLKGYACPNVDRKFVQLLGPAPSVKSSNKVVKKGEVKFEKQFWTNIRHYLNILD